MMHGEQNIKFTWDVFVFAVLESENVFFVCYVASVAVGSYQRYGTACYLRTSAICILPLYRLFHSPACFHFFSAYLCNPTAMVSLSRPGQPVDRG
jgi:hypothetical protein